MPDNFKPYTPNEILDYFEQINCIEDIQVIADYLCDNPQYYTPLEYEMLKRGLRMYAQLWTV